MIDLLRRYTPRFIGQTRVGQQVKNVLSKIPLCRTPVLKGRLYQCKGCGSEVNVYNSCTDRHCPQCGGARRADWMAKSAEVLLPGVPYFQVIFTMPDRLSSLILGNRKELYGLLFRSAWKALNSELRRTGNFIAAALMILHTWNQQQDHHPHLHALVPGAGPAAQGEGWRVAKHPQHRRRRKPYLTDNVELGRAFRKHYVRGLRLLFRNGDLKIGGSVEFLNDPVQREEWLCELEQVDWNVFIQGPPKGESKPANVVKYLASYLTGGPISDRRIIEADNDNVWFWARPKKNSRTSKGRRGMNRPRPFKLSGLQFMQRWSMHILPKGFTRSRSYGGYHGSKREEYIRTCRESLDWSIDQSQEVPEPKLVDDVDSMSQRSCPHCASELRMIRFEPRPSWREVFEISIRAGGRSPPESHVGSARSPPVRGLP